MGNVKHFKNSHYWHNGDVNDVIDRIPKISIWNANGLTKHTQEIYLGNISRNIPRNISRFIYFISVYLNLHRYLFPRWHPRLRAHRFSCPIALLHSTISEAFLVSSSLIVHLKLMRKSLLLYFHYVAKEFQFSYFNSLQYYLFCTDSLPITTFLILFHLDILSDHRI